MKRFLASIAVLVVGAMSFASSGKFGLDFSWGLNMGFQNMNVNMLGGEGKLSRTDMAFPIVRVSSYNFFLLDNMFGLFASLNLSPGFQFGDKVEANGRTIEGRGYVGNFSDVFFGIEFMVGPSFGIDINENLRFQTGLGFHYLFEKSMVEAFENKVSDSEISLSLHSFGIALTPQLRFSPAKKASFILGCDFLFDFGRSGDTEFKYHESGNGERDRTYPIPADAIDSYFRFGFSPYIGVGINF